jgi:hypothetical protein
LGVYSISLEIAFETYGIDQGLEHLNIRIVGKNIMIFLEIER